MKIQIDTINKTLTIEESVNLHDFYEEINNLLPGGTWRDYTLNVTKIIEWINPITIDTPYNPPPITTPGTNPYPGIPQIWYGPTTTSNTSGVYNLDINY
jgi:hypothetical protein